MQEVLHEFPLVMILHWGKLLCPLHSATSASDWAYGDRTPPGRTALNATLVTKEKNVFSCPALMDKTYGDALYSMVKEHLGPSGFWSID